MLSFGKKPSISQKDCWPETGPAMVSDAVSGGDVGRCGASVVRRRSRLCLAGLRCAQRQVCGRVRGRCCAMAAVAGTRIAHEPGAQRACEALSAHAAQTSNRAVAGALHPGFPAGSGSRVCTASERSARHGRAPEKPCPAGVSADAAGPRTRPRTPPPRCGRSARRRGTMSPIFLPAWLPPIRKTARAVAFVGRPFPSRARLHSYE